MCGIGQAPRALGPLPLVFSVYYLVEQIFVPFGGTKIEKPMTTV